MGELLFRLRTDGAERRHHKNDANYCGPTYKEDARRGAGSFDAL
jgi:hypothetical protein